jgi:S-adenosylmethionine:tRNA ribosyltransferase-isomerase
MQLRSRLEIRSRFSDSRRLWVASGEFVDGISVADFLDVHGRPIRYRHVPREWPIEAYQTVFAREPGSVEMPSAARPFSTELVTDLVGRGIGVAPLVLHTGVSSLEGDERPYPERYDVPRATAEGEREDLTRVGSQ